MTATVDTHSDFDLPPPDVGPADADPDDNVTATLDNDLSTVNGPNPAEVDTTALAAGPDNHGPHDGETDGRDTGYQVSEHLRRDGTVLRLGEKVVGGSADLVPAAMAELRDQGDHDGDADSDVPDDVDGAADAEPGRDGVVDEAAGNGGDDGGDAGERDTSPEGRGPYSVSFIARSIAENQVITTGVSPDATAQNHHLIDLLRSRAEAINRTSHGDVLGLQLYGSRGNGTCDVDSDADIAVLRFASDRDEEVREQVAEASESPLLRGVVIDPELGAVTALGILDRYSEDPEEFIQQIEHGAEGAASSPSSLFGNGIYHTNNLLLARLAAAEVLQGYMPSQRQHNWDYIRQYFAQESLHVGNVERMQEKLVERLGADHAPEIRSAVSEELMASRVRRFGLPADLNAYHGQLNQWVKNNMRQLQNQRGYRLLRGVRGELRKQ